MTAKRYYVGLKVCGGREAFKTSQIPTERTHGNRYAAVIGPFRTKRAYLFMARYGEGNPHLQTVADAERIAR